jgi:hypothetical protein
MTYRFFINDVKKVHGESFTDSKITSVQVLYWTLVAANPLRKNSGIKSGMGMYHSTFSSVPVLLDSANKNRQYIQLPAPIFNLPNEGAVSYIAYNVSSSVSSPNFTQQLFQPTTTGKAWLLYLNPYTYPKAKNPYFYRMQNNIYFLGIENITVKDVEIQLFTALDPLTEVNIDDEIGLADELISALRYETLNMARYAYLFPEERKNSVDATPQTKVPTQDIVKKEPTQAQQDQ